eukprot:CAMPEP_0177661470 /NCGR_PEP_ID=MMETSP0447-20121125/18704_1 /TAXON_ID=0 /ORGANISM="Stygamoeba regulata, Strain BSH-02190019" /LENGTH=158 /DNA_ID=CAMNT_0019166831 /DNA_START=101 /DNA_END=574 /DNA_ORIENTATION=+
MAHRLALLTEGRELLSEWAELRTAVREQRRAELEGERRVLLEEQQARLQQLNEIQHDIALVDSSLETSKQKISAAQTSLSHLCERYDDARDRLSALWRNAGLQPRRLETWQELEEREFSQYLEQRRMRFLDGDGALKTAASLGAAATYSTTATAATAA